MFIEMNNAILDLSPRIFCIIITNFMAEEETRDYFKEFIDEQPQPKQKEYKPDPSILSCLDSYHVPTPKMPEKVEKVHPFVKIANEKKTKLGLYAEQIINQRKRCSTYAEIAEQQQKKRAQKLLGKKKKKKVTNNDGLKEILGVSGNAKPRKTNKFKKNRESQDEDDEQSKRIRRTGPPYMPNIVCMDSLCKKSTKPKPDQKKKIKLHAGSRSRSKQHRKEKARKMSDESQVESSGCQMSVDRKKKDKHGMQIQSLAGKKISSPADRLSQQNEDEHHSSFQFQKRSTNAEVSQSSASASDKQFEKKQQMQNSKKKRQKKLNIESQEQGQHHHSNGPKPECKPQTNINIDFDKKMEQLQRMRAELQKQQQRIHIQKKFFEQQKAMLQQKAILDKRERQLLLKQAKLNNNADSGKRNQRHEHKHKSKHKMKQRSQKKDNLSSQNPDWRAQLRSVTNYYPDSMKYKIRDQGEIRESSYSRMYAEEIISRKKGKIEEELEELKSKKASKRKHS